VSALAELSLVGAYQVAVKGSDVHSYTLLGPQVLKTFKDLFQVLCVKVYSPFAWLHQRTREQLRLEGISGGHLVQPFYVSSVT